MCFVCRPGTRAKGGEGLLVVVLVQDSIEQTSSIHIDTMCDLKEFNSLMISLAYPVLAGAGMLRKSRLM